MSAPSLYRHVHIHLHLHMSKPLYISVRRNIHKNNYSHAPDWLPMWKFQHCLKLWLQFHKIYIELPDLFSSHNLFLFILHPVASLLTLLLHVPPSLIPPPIFRDREFTLGTNTTLGHPVPAGLSISSPTEVQCQATVRDSPDPIGRVRTWSPRCTSVTNRGIGPAPAWFLVGGSVCEPPWAQISWLFFSCGVLTPLDHYPPLFYKTLQAPPSAWQWVSLHLFPSTTEWSPLRKQPY